MWSVLQTPDFVRWLDGLRDRQGVARILARIRLAELGSLGDWKSLGGSLGEMRVHVGPGYRVYFLRRGARLIVLLAGGDKSSQQRDIVRASELAKALEAEDA